MPGFFHFWHFFKQHVSHNFMKCRLLCPSCTGPIQLLCSLAWVARALLMSKVVRDESACKATRWGALSQEIRACMEGIVFRIQWVRSLAPTSDWWKMTGPTSPRLTMSKVNKQSHERWVSMQSNPLRGLSHEMRACMEGSVFQIQWVRSLTQPSDWWKMTGSISMTKISGNYQTQAWLCVQGSNCRIYLKDFWKLSVKANNLFDLKHE